MTGTRTVVLEVMEPLEWQQLLLQQLELKYNKYRIFFFLIKTSMSIVHVLICGKGFHEPEFLANKCYVFVTENKTLNEYEHN